MATTLENNERHTGQKARLLFEANGTSYELIISNVSWSRDTGTTDIQHNDNLKAVKALTDIRFSGSFEYSGQNFDAINTFVYPTASGDAESNQPVRGNLIVREQDPATDEEYVYTFKQCVVTSQSRDLPSDDASSTTYDWEAEDLVVKKFDSGNNALTPNGP